MKFKSFWISFSKTQGYLLGFVSLILMIIFPCLGNLSQLTVPLIVFICVITALVFLLVPFIHMSFLQTRILPRIVQVHSEKKDKENTVLLLEPSDLFSYDSGVSIYYMDGKYEAPIGTGRVLNVQCDGLIQVIVEKWADNYMEEIKKIKGNEKNIFKSILIKPTILRGNV